MDRSLWLFCLTESEGPVPYPWERCYDTTDEILYYKNILSKSIVFDMRSRVKLGANLVHYNRRRKAIKSDHLCDILNQRSPVVLLVNCCGPQMFFLIPEFAQRCPLCNYPVIYIPHYG